jgi:hypothetical protein
VRETGRALLLLVLFVGPAVAQSAPQHENAVAAEFRLERQRFSENCGERKWAGCAQVLFTDHPLHIAVGSLAPQNGFGAGLAAVLHYDASKYLLKWNLDAVGTPNGSWRAGAYMKIIPTAMKAPHPVRVGGTGKPPKSNVTLFAAPYFDLYVQGISLNKVGFFGLGPVTSQTGRTFFGMSENIIGGDANLPMPRLGRLNAALLGEINGRFVDIRGNHHENSPSIEAVYSPASAPGLLQQPGFVQFGEGLRLKPVLFNGGLNLEYVGKFQQFVASGSGFSFRRFTLDLSHEIPLYRVLTTQGNPRNNGPDECGTDQRVSPCPSISRNRYGTLNFRFLLTESIAPAGNVVPFYFQPTLGGSDINGNAWLPSYQDYRFRAPNVMVLHGGFEHSLFSWPVGVIFGADTGKAALTRGDIDFTHLRHSFSTGLTLRAGGFPMVYLMFAWGGREGNHFIANVNTSLLGGSARPSLF